MVKELKVGGLKLPAEDFLEAATAIIGKRKRGKSGLVRVIAEELCEASLPFVWLDPVGIGWGLRSSADGKRKGYDVLVIGGEHGDVAIDARAGRDVALAVLKANVSVVIDLSRSSKGDWRRFVTDFCDTLFQNNDTSRLVIIEEASEFVPQNLRVGGPDRAMCFEAVERLVSRGRNKGIGVVLVDQRPSRVNKDVLTQVDYLMCFGVSHPIDFKALKEWVEMQADPELLAKFKDGLAGLQVREAWCWNPELSIFQKFRVRDMHTLHPDKTHLRKSGMLSAKPVTSDVSGIVGQLGDVMKRLAQQKQEGQDAKAELVKLRVEVQRLRERPEGVVKVERVEVPVLTEEDRADIGHLQEVLDGLAENEMSLTMVAREVSDLMKRVLGKQEAARTVPEPFRNRSLPDANAMGGKRPKQTLVTQRAVLTPGDKVLGGPHLTILEALARLHAQGFDRPRKAQVAAWAGYSPSGGAFNNPLGTLRSEGLVDKTNDGTMALTKEGEKVAGQPQPLGREELQEQVLRMLPGPEGALLKALMAVYPKALPKEDLAAATGYDAAGGAFNNPRGHLHTMGLIEYPGSGLSKAADFLFPDTR